MELFIIVRESDEELVYCSDDEIKAYKELKRLNQDENNEFVIKRGEFIAK